MREREGRRGREGKRRREGGREDAMTMDRPDHSFHTTIVNMPKNLKGTNSYGDWRVWSSAVNRGDMEHHTDFRKEMCTMKHTR